jgi:hypothetical protein
MPKTSLMAKKQAQWAAERQSQQENEGLGMQAPMGEQRGAGRREVEPLREYHDNAAAVYGTPGSLVEKKRMQWMQEQQEMGGRGNGNALLNLGNGDPKIRESQQRVHAMEGQTRQFQGDEGYDPRDDQEYHQAMQTQQQLDNQSVYSESQYTAPEESQYSSQAPSQQGFLPGSKAEQKRMQWQAEREAAAGYDQSMFGHMGLGDRKLHDAAQRRTYTEQVLGAAPSAASPARGGSLMERKQAQWAQERAAQSAGFR